MKSFKGVVDKILDLVRIFNGHFRNQRGQLPQKNIQDNLFLSKFTISKKYYIHVLIFRPICIH